MLGQIEEEAEALDDMVRNLLALRASMRTVMPPC